jgi:hypothetical protein
MKSEIKLSQWAHLVDWLRLETALDWAVLIGFGGIVLGALGELVFLAVSRAALF